ncbi:MAG: pectinesterase [Bacteroidetes bacterium]|nr:pectinesterase [Bacteroidota bacterium]MBS1931868.1 pectinesterase [Bacteroidota bacterium]
MKQKTIHIICIVLSGMINLGHIKLCAQGKRIVVDIKGSGDFISIQAAINSLPDNSDPTRVIFIKKGLYAEKIFIEKNNITLTGEDRDATIIKQNIARDEWRCNHPDDWGVATMNINGNDITLENLTVENNYGFEMKGSREVECPLDSISHKHIITDNGHQMALRTILATRLKAIHCHFKAFGGDTVSPWNVDSGMFYFKDCVMEGGVDFYCPRGWAWAEDCKFFANTGPASIWHDGSQYPDSKTVLMHCSFDGYNGFKLGRYHRDAQFFLINCSFSKNMADKDIYLVPTANSIHWGRRVYYYNCHREGGDYTWFSNQLPADIKANDISVDWLFKNKWHPQGN